ncbi:hypothetical protein [Paraburkholderia sp. PGU19]|uniref:hypothetical protein n=1 Tax=Paraburkholderia sp. PGU19 TaxID=2735434 RepID=UPI0015DA1C13|nr:hypothetical protein [Paraburkholderia sp. PGU19]
MRAELADPLANGSGNVFAFLCGQLELQPTLHARVRHTRPGQQCRQAFWSDSRQGFGIDRILLVRHRSSYKIKTAEATVTVKC